MKRNKTSYQHKPHPSKTWKEQSLGFLKELGIIVGIVLLLNSFVIASFEVPSASMEDTVKVGDRLLVNKFIYGGSTPYTIPITSIRIPHFRTPGFKNISRGDVIVFDWPGPRDKVEKPQQTWYLKRCIGLPGDIVRIENRVVYVNDRKQENPAHSKFLRAVPEPREEATPDIFPAGTKANADNYGPVIVPKKGMSVILTPDKLRPWEVFIQREGHAVSADGEKVLIDGKASNYYEVQRDYVFAMGDNRDNSLDSRYWGFVPVEDVIGTPIIVYWSWDLRIPIGQITDRLASIDISRIGTIIR
jgi:signal peptidase I